MIRVYLAGFFVFSIKRAEANVPGPRGQFMIINRFRQRLGKHTGFSPRLLPHGSPVCAGVSVTGFPTRWCHSVSCVFWAVVKVALPTKWGPILPFVVCVQSIVVGVWIASHCGTRRVASGWPTCLSHTYLPRTPPEVGGGCFALRTTGPLPEQLHPHSVHTSS